MAKTRATRQQILEVAHARCGFEELRPGQEEATCSILQLRDTLVVAPTGSGKSAIYQIAGVLSKGTTVVVSPLFALQKDQLKSLAEYDIRESAVVLNFQLQASELRATLAQISRVK